MEKYGKILERSEELVEIETVYQLFIEYFGNPEMTKLKEVQNYSVYITKIHCLLGNEFRYIFAFTHADGLKLGHREKLSNLKWVSLQTRSLQEEHSLPLHFYVAKRIPALDRKIVIDKSKPKYTYTVDRLPIVITMLPRKPNQELEYANTGSVTSAIETYSTVITFR